MYKFFELNKIEETHENIEKYKNKIINYGNLIKNYCLQYCSSVRLEEDETIDFLPKNHIIEDNGIKFITQLNSLPIIKLLYINGLNGFYGINTFGCFFARYFYKAMKREFEENNDNINNDKFYDETNYCLLLQYNAYKDIFIGFNEDEIREQIPSILVERIIDSHIIYKQILNNINYDIQDLETRETKFVVSRFIKLNKESNFVNNKNIYGLDDIEYYKLLETILLSVSSYTEESLFTLYKTNLSLFCDVCLLEFIFASRVIFMNDKYNVLKKYDVKIFDNDEFVKQYCMFNISYFHVYDELMFLHTGELEKINNLNVEINEVIEKDDKLLTELMSECEKFNIAESVISRAKLWNNRYLHIIGHTLVMSYKKGYNRNKIIELAIKIFELNIDNYFKKQIKNVNNILENLITEELRFLLAVYFDYNKYFNTDEREFYNVPSNYPYSQEKALKYLFISYKFARKNYIDIKCIYLYGLVLYKEILKEGTKEEGRKVILLYNELIKNKYKSARDIYLDRLEYEKKYGCDLINLDSLNNEINKMKEDI